jgi:uncharacterized coiled-coil DUF342 family protein
MEKEIFGRIQEIKEIALKLQSELSQLERSASAIREEVLKLEESLGKISPEIKENQPLEAILEMIKGIHRHILEEGKWYNFITLPATLSEMELEVAWLVKELSEISKAIELIDKRAVKRIITIE